MADDRLYVDRAVQTDSAVPPPSSPTSSPPAVPIFQSELSAYTDINGASSLPEFSLIVRRLQKPRLPFNGPSRAPSNDRVVSLPETSPPSRVDPGELGARIVSLPECSKSSLPKDDSFSSECFEASISTDNSGIHLLENSLQRTRTRRLRYSSLPRTPSPPSSPESIMIIGNDVQVPVSFLHKTESRPAFEEKGWLTWASSPPRPIPALHGPLSLPYARCPSGAEGTIIEGEDMSRMIWGLGTDAPLSSDPRRHPSCGGERKAVHLPSALTQSQGLKTTVLQHTTRQESQPLPILTLAPAKHSMSVLQSPQVNSTFVQEKRNLGVSHSNSRHERRSNFELTKGMSFPESPQDFSASDDHLVGLGIHWSENSVAKDTNHPYNSASSLSRISPVLPRSGPRLFVESRTNPQLTSQVIIPTGPRMSAIDIAHQYRIKQLQNALLTPPNFSELQWSPYFSASSDKMLYHEYNPPPFERPVLKARNSDTELRRFVVEHMNNPDIFIDDPPVLPLRPSRPTIHIYSSDAQSSCEMSPPPGTPLNSPLPPAPSVYNPKTSRSTSTPPPTSPEFQRRFRTISRQPRSIPLARLIQRRLSVVPEEDIEGFLESTAPMSSTLRDHNPQSPPIAHLRRTIETLPSPQKAGRSGPHSNPFVLGVKPQYTSALNNTADYRKSSNIPKGSKENEAEETLVKKGRAKNKK